MEKLNKLFKHILTDDITEMNTLIYVEAKIVSLK